MPPILFHLTSPEDANAPRLNGDYHAPSLATEGFIHCCTAAQLPGVIQRYYADSEALVLLHIDTKHLSADLVFENTVGGTELFPHVYGPICKNAISEHQQLNKSKIEDIAGSDEFLI